MPQTIYRPVPGYTDLYAGMDSTIVHGERGELEKKVWKGKGYHYVSIPGAGSARVYTLVAAAFLGPRPPGMEVRHGDGSKDNDHLSNLCYGTHSDNARDMVGHNTHRNVRKTECPQGHKYTPENTLINPNNGWRQCRTCQDAHARRTEDECRGDLHRRYITDDQREIIDRLLADESSLSNRAIAKLAGVSHTTVRRYRIGG